MTHQMLAVLEEVEQGEDFLTRLGIFFSNPSLASEMWDKYHDACVCALNPQNHTDLLGISLKELVNVYKGEFARANSGQKDLAKC